MLELVKVDKNINQIREIVDYEDIYKLVKDDKIIGYGTINKDKENIIYVFIEQDLRGNGYGKILFSEMIKIIEKLGYKDVKIIFKRENIQMLKITEKMGGLHLSSKEGEVQYLIPISKSL